MGLAIGGPELGGSIERTVDSPSVRMWLEYFSQAHVVGFDITDFSHIKHPRFSFIRGDSGNAEDVTKLLGLGDGYDLIIDDASHASYHQQLAFKILFEKVKPGGLYIIEDLQWQSPFFEDSFPKIPKTAEFFDNFFEKQVYLDNILISEQFMDKTARSLASYALFNSFGKGGEVPKMIVLRKKMEGC